MACVCCVVKVCKGRNLKVMCSPDASESQSLSHAKRKSRGFKLCSWLPQVLNSSVAKG